jgi:hypothetical protein
MDKLMTTEITSRSASCLSARQQARIAGVFYVLNTITSLYAYYGPKGRLSFMSGMAGTATYIVVTVVFYFLFRPVSRSLSLIAAVFSLAGSTVGVLSALHLLSFDINTLIFFGFYCVLIGYLIFRSIFLPRFIGVLMAFAGVGYLTFLSPHLGNMLSPWNLIPGGLGEWTLTAWLLVKGVDQQRWDEQSRASAA